jgi:putative hydrolase of the HAD superfamily
MPLEAVFLDVGNTLLTEDPSRFAIYAEAGRERGLDVDEPRMHALMRAAQRELPERVGGAYRYSDAWFAAFVERIFADHLGLPREQVPALLDELFGRFEDARTFRLFPGAVELLEGLRDRGLRVGAISNWSARLPRVLAAMDLGRHFDFVLCSALLELEKPDPAIFAAALERAGVSPDRALHAGDDPVNDGAAAGVGLDVVLIDRDGRHGECGLRRVRDLHELARYVEELA